MWYSSPAASDISVLVSLHTLHDMATGLTYGPPSDCISRDCSSPLEGTHIITLEYSGWSETVQNVIT